MESKKGIEILPYGEAALLVNFIQLIDEAVNLNVIRLAGKIKAENLQGVVFVQTAYCSLIVGFNPEELSFEFLKNFISTVFETLDEPGQIEGAEKKELSLPVCYEGEYAPDMIELESILNLSKKEIIDLHTSTVFQVYMLGFLPGFPYLGKLPKKLECPRKENPRKKVPALSVGLAGMQTGIYPVEAPGGWQIIGRTPVKILDAQRDNLFLLKPGDKVKFYSISEIEFERINEEVTMNKFDHNSLHV